MHIKFPCLPRNNFEYTLALYFCSYHAESISLITVSEHQSFVSKQNNCAK